MAVPASSDGAEKPARGVLLLVGDSREWPPDLEGFLAGAGYATERAPAFESVLPRVESASVQALLVVAGPLGASDLLHLRRVRERSPRTAIVVVTNTPTSPDLMRALESGATAFLSWPASADAVRQAVESGGSHRTAGGTRK